MKRIAIKITTGLLAAVLPEGCAMAESPAAQFEQRSIEAQPVAADRIAEQPSTKLTLEQALAAALTRSPELSAFSYRVRAAEARMLQARLLPNPELGVEIEEYNRDGAGFDSAETAVSLGQRFELGGKRSRRMRVAEVSGELANWDYESRKLDVMAETTRRFVELLAAQERVDLASSSVKLAKETNVAVAERVKAGKEPPFQQAKSDAELEMARMQSQTAQSRLAVARQRLVAMWGAEEAMFDRAQGRLDRELEAVPSLNDLRSQLSSNPDLARWKSELRLRRAALDSEKVQRIPDLQASVGFKQYEADGTDALMFGIGMPLPLFDRNQGNIAAAAHDISRAEAERSAAELDLATELGEVHSALTTAHQHVTTLHDKVVPAMEQAYNAVHIGYRQGKFGMLDMLDAQRRLFDAQAALIDARTNYHNSVADLHRILGTGTEEAFR